nr:MAG TPA: protein of unknown function (DUF4376) [Caudoviricetes sp.]
MMVKTWTYKDTVYQSEWLMRQELFKQDRVACGEAPAEGAAEFWAQFGVAYAEEPDLEPNIDELRNQKLSSLESAFMQWYQTDATCTSSLGFVVDSDARAMLDVSGLVTTLEATPVDSRGGVTFMDHNNIPHMLTLSQLKTVQLEIIKTGQAAYEQKWTMRSAIGAAKTPDDLDAVEIRFTGVDFTMGAA